MDDPFSALDELMKQNFIQEIEKLHKRYGITTIMVSHDVQASYYLADRVLVLAQGKIVKDGTPNEVFISTQKVVYHL